MQSKGNIDSLLLKIKKHVLHFPSGFNFTMNIPQQITVYEITQIMRNYRILHDLHGLKFESKTTLPKYLASLDGNIIVDLYLSDKQSMQKQLTPICKSQFKILYGIQAGGENTKNGFCASKKYQMLGKMNIKDQKGQKNTKYSQFVARNRQTCLLSTITAFAKKQLNFNCIESLIWVCKQSQNWQKQSSPLFIPVNEVFETQNFVCLVTKQLPFQIERIKFEEKPILDIILSQVAKILHILMRSEVDISGIALSSFWMDFRLKVSFLCTQIAQFYQQDNKNTEGLHLVQQNMEFSNKMAEFLEGFLRNCNIKVIEMYIPLLHWLKNKRISNYLQFLRYFQVSTNIEDIHRKSMVENLIKSYSAPKLTDLSCQQLSQYSKTYKSRTQTFSTPFFPPTQPPKPTQLDSSPQPHQIQQLIQNISTIKKKKHETLLYHKAVGHRDKKRKNGIKKNVQNRSFVSNKKTKQKSRNHSRNVSEFLIQD